MEQGMLNNGQRQQLEGIAALGRNEDTYLAHVAPDEMIVPAQALRDNPLLKQAIEKSISKYGIDPNQFVVGNGSMDLNPLTGLPEFGFLSKVWKKAKKIVKKVAPVAALIPGVGTALGGVLGGIGGLATKIPGIGGALGKLGTSAMSGIAKLGIPGISSIAGGTAGGFGGIGSALTTKAGLFGGGPLAGIMGVGGPQVPEGLEMGADGMYVDAAGNTYDYQQLVDMGVMDRSGNIINTPLADLSNRGVGSFFGRETPQFIKSIGDSIGLGGESGLQDFYGSAPSQKGSMQVGGGNAFSGLMGGLTSPMGLAGLTGLAAYMAAKKEEGGLSETPKVTMDQLGRYQMAQNLGTGGSRADFGLAPAPVALQFAYGGEARQYFNQGGLAMVEELDMRDGGESAGPGTGTSDDIPAMLSDGEFVMTAKATRGAGAFDVNKTKSGIELIKGGSASREKGVKNMRELMNIFEAI
jgi:hypothetical protein